MADENPYRDIWYTIFAVGHPALVKFQTYHRRLPSPPRCRMCFAPFRGPGAILMKFMKKEPNPRNPNFCNACDAFMRKYPGSAEVEMSMLFVDVRESTPLASRISATAFGETMKRFYHDAVQTINAEDGFIIGLVGDEVVAAFPPGFCGKDHAQKAVRAAKRLLQLNLPTAPDGTRVQLGVGVHTGSVYIGTSSDSPAGATDVAVLGDNVNMTARLATTANPSEALISEATCSSAGVTGEDLEVRTVTLKGKEEPVQVRVWRIS